MIRLFKKFKRWIYAKLDKITPGKTAIKGASIALLISSIILFLLFALSSTLEAGDPWLFIFFIGFAGLFVVSAYISLWVIKKFNHIPKRYKIAVLIAIPLFLSALAFEGLYIITAIIITSLLGASIAIILKGTFRKLTTPKKVVTILGFILGLGGFISAIIAYIPTGFEMKPIINAAAVNTATIKNITAPSPAKKGTYPVKTLTYGSGKDHHRPEFGENVTIKTDSVNGVPFLDNWEGFSGWYREQFWGFNAKSLPVNGYVWYPEGEGPFPLALVVHGNHMMQDFSDTGYGYLGELLASRGIIFASVDENFFNSSWSDITGGLDEENDARGWMLLEHLRVWQMWNTDKENIFYNKIDTTKLALLGHSRGGEAVAHAALLNKMPSYYDDATIPLDYDYDIQSIVAIAPVDGQYEPGNARTTLKDINYLVLHGAQDADVSSYAGSKQYERITFSDSTHYFKSGIYIQGANHGQFNTSWGDNDVGSFTKLLNNKPLLPAEDQRKIAQVYISAFLETTLKDNTTYKSLFTDARKGKDWLPETIYLNQYEDASFEAIASFDEDFNVHTATAGSSTIASEHVSVWREQEIKLKWGEKGSRASYIGWHYDDLEEGEIVPDSIQAKYIIHIPDTLKTIDSTSIFMFSMAESTESSNPKTSGKWVNKENETNEIAENNTSDKEGNEDESEKDENKKDKPKEPINFSIKMTDASGEIVHFPLSHFSALQRELKVRIWKSQFLKDEDSSENIFQTFSYSLSDIQTFNPFFNITTIRKIAFIFDKTPKGVVVIDDIGFMKQE
ncbi:hypothetical protein [Dokdonia sp.]|uniref:poly(ethylene terephthalate) hydrolase family protein n=1 Tax=Dokdonia sp. TaxID=2024995 RepID=UPI0032646963